MRVLLLLCLLLLTACGTTQLTVTPASTQTATAVPAVAAAAGGAITIQVSVGAEQRPGPAANPTLAAEPEATVISEQRLTLTVSGMKEQEGIEWQMWQLAGTRPLLAASGESIAWIRSAALVTTPALQKSELAPRPSGDYTVLYTPYRADGGDLEQGAEVLMHLPGISIINDMEVDQRPTELVAVVANHFMLGTSALPFGAQSGAVQHYYLLNPVGMTAQDIAQFTWGGGSFSAVAHGERWLFWSSYTLDDSGGPGMRNIVSKLVDLATGESRDVGLGRDNWPEDASWQEDSKFHFTLRPAGVRYTLDPATGVIAKGVSSGH